MLKKDSPLQRVFYQPGVGTIDPERSTTVVDRIRNSTGRFYDNMTAWMIYRHVSSAYLYLMNNLEHGDEIFLFGFSRGAYIARIVAGMIHKVGLLHSGQVEMLPFAWQVYTPRGNHEQAGRFKKYYSRNPTIRFLGLWDTVSSVLERLNPFQSRVFPSTAKNSSVNVVRHALAIDERRVMFRPNLWTPTDDQDVLQVWFAGAHADVGGGYTGDSTPGLAGLPLGWMVQEAKLAGLDINIDEEKKLLWPRALTSPSLITIQDLTTQYKTAEQHDEIQQRFHWWLIERIPVLQGRRDATGNWHRVFSRHLGSARDLVPPDHELLKLCVHQSVDERTKAIGYMPSNLQAASKLPRIW
jgi:uncharacterized protein (DUF2235 family)